MAEGAWGRWRPGERSAPATHLFRGNALTCAKQGKDANTILVRSYTPKATRKAFVVAPR